MNNQESENRIQKSLKDCSDEEIHWMIDRAFEEIRKSPNGYGDIIITISGGKVKYIDVRKPLF